ncbi:MAG: HAD-IIB family hydrolase [Erysipelotrichaceae bacterium]|nr:HAD-IIB family hydrolase [Erysipelotrichaceae bacterium]
MDKRKLFEGRGFFVFDNDQTLFDHSIHTVRDKTYEALEKLKKNGHLLCLNTSRSPEETVNIPKRLQDMMDVIILLDGAYVIHGKDVEVTYLDDELLPGVISFLEEHDVTYRYCLDTETGYLNREDSDHAMLFQTLYDMTPETKAYEGERVIHILYYATGDLREEIIRRAGDMETNRMTIAGEISPKEKSKGKAMLETAEKLGIARDHVVAFGDAGNDVDMLRLAGTGVAMGNADRECKDAADYVTDDISDEGIFNALVRFGFIEE